MLKTFAIQGYRGFESYRLANLARVNLIVGKNNCGKTSILEAIELLVSGGNPSVFNRLARRRSELITRYSARPYGWAMDFSHVFFGHTFDLGASFHLSSNDGGRTVSVQVAELDEVAEAAYFWNSKIKEQVLPGLGLSEQDEDAPPVSALRIDASTLEEPIALPVLEGGTVVFDRLSASTRDRFSESPAHFLTVDSFDPTSMGEMWNTALSESREGQIVDDLKILEPTLDSIHFLTGGRPASGILLGFANGGPRMPISTFGDGMRRLLALRLSFVGTANGFLLVDEIDTGLHWTVMEEMWRFVVEVARKNRVQIFATTHSYDCIRGLASLIRSRPDLMDQVCIQKVDTSLKQAVCLRGQQINVAVEQDIEVR